MALLARMTTAEVTRRSKLVPGGGKVRDETAPAPVTPPQPILKSSQALTEFRRPLAPAVISSQQQLLQQQEQAKFRQQLDLLVPKVTIDL